MELILNIDWLSIEEYQDGTCESYGEAAVSYLWWEDRNAYSVLTEQYLDEQLCANAISVPISILVVLLISIGTARNLRDSTTALHLKIPV